MAFVADLAQDHYDPATDSPGVVGVTAFKDMRVRKTQIETASGLYFDLNDPDPDTVMVDDIASALSKACRFAGHVSEFYSVAEHTVLVHDIVRVWDGSEELSFAALHHDSPEAYYGDVTTPLKAILGESYADVRRAVDEAVAEALAIDVELFHHPMVVKADLLALRAEAARLKHSKGRGWGIDHIKPTLPKGLFIECLEPADAEATFLMAHDECP